MNASIRIATLAVTSLLAALPLDAHAQAARQGGGASAQLLMQLQQLANEKTGLQAEVSKLKGELEKASKERDSLKQSLESIGRRSRGVETELATAAADKARLEGEVAQEKSRVQELVSRVRETAISLRDVETQANANGGKLQAREQELQACVDRNRKLIALNDEVLRRFEDQGLWSAVAKREPFTRLKRSQLENLADGYRDAAEEQRVQSSTASRH